MVYRPHKALYSLKHAPRAWNKKIDSYSVALEFTKCEFEYGVQTNLIEEVQLVSSSRFLMYLSYGVRGNNQINIILI